MTIERKYYTTNEVMELLQICRRTLYTYIEKGYIKPHKTPSKKVYFSKKDVDNFIK